MGKAINAMTSYGLAPVNDDTVKQVTELLIPAKPKPVWTDTRAEFGPRPAQLRGRRLWMDIRAPPNPDGGTRRPLKPSQKPSTISWETE